MNIKISELRGIESRIMVLREKGVWRGEMSEENQKVQTSCYKRYKSSDVMYSMMTTINNIVLHLKVANRVYLKSFHHKKKCSYVRWYMIFKFIVVISSQCM